MVKFKSLQGDTTQVVEWLLNHTIRRKTKISSIKLQEQVWKLILMILTTFYYILPYGCVILGSPMLVLGKSVCSDCVIRGLLETSLGVSLF